MKTQVANFDDIVFENRNKNYGAFFIRRQYNKALSQALFFTVLIITGITSIPLLAGHSNKVKKDLSNTSITTAMFTPPEKKDDKPIKLPPPPVALMKVKEFRAPVVTNEKVDDVIPIDFKEGTDVDNVKFGTSGNFIIPDEVVEKIKENGVDMDIKQTASLDIMPSFIGGDEAMEKYISNNIIYPEYAKKVDIEGKIFVSFVIERDGSVTNVKALNDIGGGCAEEAVRVVQKMLKWREGRQGGKSVRAYFMLPIQFELLQY